MARFDDSNIFTFRINSISDEVVMKLSFFVRYYVE